MLHIPNRKTGTTRLIPYLIFIKSEFLFHSFPTVALYTTVDEINVSLPIWSQPHTYTPILTQQLELQVKYR